MNTPSPTLPPLGDGERDASPARSASSAPSQETATFTAEFRAWIDEEHARIHRDDVPGADLRPW